LNEQMEGWRTNVTDWAASAGAQVNEDRKAASATPGSLYRSRSNRVFMGVCGGIAERYGVDPTLVRLMWALLAIASLGLGVLAYAFAAMLLPEEGAAAAPASRDPNAVEDITITEANPGDESVQF